MSDKQAGYEKKYENQVFYIEDRVNAFGGNGDPMEHLEVPGGELMEGDKTKIEAPAGTDPTKDIEISGMGQFQAGPGLSREKSYTDYAKNLDSIPSADMSNQDLQPLGYGPNNDFSSEMTGFYSVRCASMNTRIASARRVLAADYSTMNKKAFFGGESVIFSKESHSAEQLSRHAANDIWGVQASDGVPTITRLSNSEVSA